jgi:hypothetical protein
MEFDPSNLSFILNVMGITTITSACALWAFRMQDKLVASNESTEPRRGESGHHSRGHIPMREMEDEGGRSATIQAARQDIREFVRHRVAAWTAQAEAHSVSPRRSTFDQVLN